MRRKQQGATDGLAVVIARIPRNEDTVAVVSIVWGGPAPFRQGLGNLELKLGEPGVEAACGDQARMRPRLDDPALIHHQDAIA